MRIIILLGGIILMSLSSWAVSRVGNGNKSVKDLVLPQIPQLPVLSTLANGNVRYKNPIPRMFRKKSVDYMDIRNINSEFPGLTQLQKKAFAKQMSEWNYVKSTPVKCATVYTRSNSNTVVNILTWGDQKGAVFITRDNKGGRRAMKQLLDRVGFKDGACKKN